MADWNTGGGDDDAWAQGNAAAFTTDVGEFGAASNDFGGDNAFGGGVSGGDTEPKKLTGECFRCGEIGHNKADCTNEPIDRPFTGTCNSCGQEGHRSSSCPEAECRLCHLKGHTSGRCTEKRVLDYEGAPKSSADAAWAAMLATDKEKDLNEFRKAFMQYAKAMATSEGGADSFNLVELEKSFRHDNMNAHLVAKQKDIPLNYTIVDFQGNADKTYVLGIQWAAKSRRKAFAEALAESPEENLVRLADCGLVMDRGVPVCGNCKELGHIRKHCKQEPQFTGKEMSVCGNCGGEHRLRDCKEERVDKRAAAQLCRNCNKPGHRASDCTEPRSAENVECRRCSEMGDEHGHESRACTKKKDWSRVTCSNCQKTGHGKARCPEPLAEENGTTGGNGGDGSWGGATGNTGASAATGGWNDSGADTITADGGWSSGVAITTGGDNGGW